MALTRGGRKRIDYLENLEPRGCPEAPADESGRNRTAGEPVFDCRRCDSRATPQTRVALLPAKDDTLCACGSGRDLSSPGPAPWPRDRLPIEPRGGIPRLPFLPAARPCLWRARRRRAAARLRATRTGRVGVFPVSGLRGFRPAAWRSGSIAPPRRGVGFAGVSRAGIVASRDPMSVFRFQVCRRRPAPRRRVGVVRWTVPVGLFVLLVALALPRVPPGICSHDGGDLQVASATLGIAHPPGYAVLVSVGHVLSRPAAVVGLDPARVVSLGCLAAGLVALLLAVLVQVRLGVSAWIAVGSVVLLAAHPHVWVNLVTPEVYAPSLALLGGAVWFLCAYRRRGRGLNLFLAAVFLGAAAVSRPPMVLAVAGFALGLALVPRDRPRRARRAGPAILVAAGGLALPVVYSVGYVWLRDRPEVPCNYIERFNETTGSLPPADAGPDAKGRRVFWLLAAQQYRSLMSLGGDVTARCVWLAHRLAPHHPLVLAAVVVLAITGALNVPRRQRPTAVFVAGIGVASAVFLLVYRVSDDAANTLPLLWALAVLAGIGADRLLPQRSGGWRTAVTVVAGLAASTWAVVQIRNMPDFAARADATAFVAEADLGTLPADALVLTEWGHAAPLLYARHVTARRNDIRIITASAGQWPKLARRYGRLPGGRARPVFFVRRIAVPQGMNLRRSRNLWRLEGGLGE